MAKPSADPWSDEFEVLYQQAQDRLLAARLSKDMLKSAFDEWVRRKPRLQIDDQPVKFEDRQRVAMEMLVNVLPLMNPSLGEWEHMLSYQEVLESAALLTIRMMDALPNDEERENLCAVSRLVSKFGASDDELREARLGSMLRRFMRMLVKQHPSRGHRAYNRLENALTDSEAGASIFMDAGGDRDVLPYMPDDGWSSRRRAA